MLLWHDMYILKDNSINAISGGQSTFPIFLGQASEMTHCSKSIGNQAESSSDAPKVFKGPKF